MALSTVGLYLAPESTFGADPDSDGSDYLAAQIMGRPMFSRDLVVAASNYASGRNRETTHLIGPDGAILSADFAAISLSAASTDGVAPPTKDWLDYLLDAAFGTAGSVTGEGMAGGGSTTSLVLDADALDVEDLACVNFSNRSEWRNVTVDSGAPTYTIAPALSGSYDASRDMLGHRYWRYTDTAGATCAIYTVIGGTGYTLLGGRPAVKISMRAGEESIKVATSWKFDSVTRGSKASIPAISRFTNTPVRPVLSPVLWGSTTLAAKVVEIDFGATPTDIGSTAGTNGRASIDNLSARPTITIEPAFSTDLEDDWTAGTERTLMIQLGSGAISGGRANTLAFFAQSAQIVSAEHSDDGGYLRHKITLRVMDGGIRTGTTAYRYWTLARA